MNHTVLRSTVYNSQDMEITEVSIKGEMDKDDTVHIFSGILLSHLKEWDDVIWSNVDGFGDYVFHTKWSKTEKDIYYMISPICGI